MPTLSDFLDLPEEVTKSAFVVRLIEAVQRPDALMATYAVTPDIHDALDRGLGLTLAGKPWQVLHIDWKKGVCIVEPAARAAAARWGGAPRFLSYALTQAIREVLTTETVDASWSRRAQEVIATERATHIFLRDEPSPITSESDELTWWTYAGGSANVLLARLLESELGGKCVVRNSSITCKEEAGKSEIALRDVIRNLAAGQRPNRQDAVRFAQSCLGKQRLSKFQACLPDGQLDEFLAEAIDWEGSALAAKRGCELVV